MRLRWALSCVVELATMVPSYAEARDWWVLEPDGTCRTPHVFSSPADEVKTLIREGHSVEVKKADFPDGSFVLLVNAPVGVNLWSTSQQTCEFIVATRREAPVDNNWDDFQ